MKKLLIILLFVPLASFSQTYNYEAEMYSYKTESYVYVEIEIEQGNSEVEIYSFDTGEYYYADIESSKVLSNGRREMEIYFYGGLYEGYAEITNFQRK
tara:strand:+ start:118 stop:411 length:294 start_codon:yes stop_codon:yes gene_type:complete